MSNWVKGYKATDKDGKCRGFQFRVGRSYIEDKKELCKSGFHFCLNLFDVYNYYEKSENTRIFEIEALDPISEDDKFCTQKIKIIKELSDKELLKAWINRNNSGDWNSGYGNSGNRNSGNRNSGYGNSGDWNSGYGNSGDWNSGYGNSGNRNSGNWNSGDGNSGNRNSGDGNSGYGSSGNRNSGDGNSGDWNSGYGNSGNRNSGDWNSGDGNSGYFNTTIPVYFFNKPSDIVYTKELENKLRSINVKPILTWIATLEMTELEKNNHPVHKVTNGFLRKTDRYDWTRLTDQDKEFILSLPNYDDEVFKIISNGVSLLKAKTIKIVHDGKDFEIDIEKARKLGLLK